LGRTWCQLAKGAADPLPLNPSSFLLPFSPFTRRRRRRWRPSTRAWGGGVAAAAARAEENSGAAEGHLGGARARRWLVRGSVKRHLDSALGMVATPARTRGVPPAAMAAHLPPSHGGSPRRQPRHREVAGLDGSPAHAWRRRVRAGTVVRRAPAPAHEDDDGELQVHIHRLPL